MSRLARPTYKLKGAAAGVTTDGLVRAAERLTPIILAVAVAIAAAYWITVLPYSLFGFDFRGAIWQPARDVFAGRSPFPPPNAHQLLLRGNPGVYPPTAFVAAVPLGFLPLTLAAALWDVVTTGCLAASLRLVGVRDWRIYGVVLLSLPFSESMYFGQIEGLLALGCAIVWRYRDRTTIPAAAVAVVVSLKFFLWPLVFWLAVTRGMRSALLAVAGSAALLLGAWSIVGLQTLLTYPRLLAADSDAFEGRGVSFAAAGLHAGLPAAIARFLPLLGAAALILVALRFARLGLADRAFAAFVAAGIFSSPIVWMHSLLVLLVGLAVVRPRFSAIWLLPLALWAAQNPVKPAEFVAGECLILILVTLALRSGQPATRSFEMRRRRMIY